MLDGDEVQPADGSNWRNRLSQSREVGTGFAAPGGSFTRALYEWSFTPKGQIMHSLLKNRRVVELGAGMMSYGYALANHCGAKNFVAVEPFYADVQKASIQTYLSENPGMNDRIPHKVIDLDMLAYLQAEPDNLLCIIACGIEDCILPSFDYRKKVESEIVRTMEKDSFFLSSHSDLFPQGLQNTEICFPRPSSPQVFDRLRLHGRKEAFEYYGDISTLLQLPS